MKLCPECQHLNSDTYQVCENCHSVLPKSNNYEDKPAGYDNTDYQNNNYNNNNHQNYSGYQKDNFNQNNPNYQKSNYNPYNNKSGDGTAALICGILSLFCCGIILGPIAISLGNKSNDSAGQAGKILGIIALCLWLGGIFLQACGALMFI